MVDKKVLLLRYGPLLIAVYGLLKHFQPRRAAAAGGGGKKDNDWQEDDKRRVAQARLKSIAWALKSRTLWNMLAVALGVTYMFRRLFGFRAERTFPAFLVTIWTLVYKWRIVENPKVFYRRTYWNTHIVEKAKITQTQFWPVFWLFNRHAQTVACYALSELEWLWAHPIGYERETIPCHDYPNLQFIDWAHFKDEEGDNEASTLPSNVEAAPGQWDSPVILCIHGLGDHKDIAYLKRFVRTCLRNGWRVAVWSWWKFTLDDSRDLKLVVDHIHEKYPQAPIVGVGWSAGAYPLVTYLEKAGSNTPMVCAVCQAGCLDFVQACKDVTENENTTYPLFLLAQTHVCIRRHVRNDQNIKDKSKFDSLYTELDPMTLFNKFFSMIPPPLPDETGGYGPDGFIGTEGDLHERVRTAAHYTSSAIDNIDKIKVHTLILHSEDDPIVSSEHVNWGKVENNRHVIVAHTKRGGHCAWHEGFFPFGETWGDRVASNFISTVLESHSQTHFFIEIVRHAMNTAQFQIFNNNNNRQQQNNNNMYSPQTMARICSASDLASMGSAPVIQQQQKK